MWATSRTLAPTSSLAWLLFLGLFWSTVHLPQYQERVLIEAILIPIGSLVRLSWFLWAKRDYSACSILTYCDRVLGYSVHVEWRDRRLQILAGTDLSCWCPS